MRRRCGFRGFTLLETLLSAAIVAVAAALVLPALGAARAAAARSTCAGHLRKIGVAFRLYQEDYGELPNPMKLTASVRDKRVLVCPADTGERSVFSSYAFRTDIPPDFKPYWEQTVLNDSTVITVCNQHLEIPRGKDGSTIASAAPEYPFKLVLRASGAVQQVPVNSIREILKEGADRPMLVRVYPGEPWYPGGTL